MRYFFNNGFVIGVVAFSVLAFALFMHKQQPAGAQSAHWPDHRGQFVAPGGGGGASGGEYDLEGERLYTDKVGDLDTYCDGNSTTDEVACTADGFTNLVVTGTGVEVGASGLELRGTVDQLQILDATKTAAITEILIGQTTIGKGNILKSNNGNLEIRRADDGSYSSSKASIGFYYSSAGDEKVRISGTTGFIKLPEHQTPGIGYIGWTTDALSSSLVSVKLGGFYNSLTDHWIAASDGDTNPGMGGDSTFKMGDSGDATHAMASCDLEHLGIITVDTPLASDTASQVWMCVADNDGVTETYRYRSVVDQYAFMSANDNAVAIDIVTAGVGNWVHVDTLTCDGRSGFSCASSKWTADTAILGGFVFAGSVSTSGGSSQTYEFTVATDDGVITNEMCYSERKMAAGGDVGAIPLGPCPITVASGDDIYLRVRQVGGGATNITVRDANLWLRSF